MAGGVNEARAVFKHFGLILIKQHDRSADPTDVEWLIALIKYQDGKVYYRCFFSLHSGWLILLKKTSPCKLSHTFPSSGALSRHYETPSFAHADRTNSPER